MKISLVLISLFLFPFSSPSFSETSVNINLDSWIYPALERLVSAGLINSSLMNARPLTRMEGARLTGEAIASAREKEHGGKDGLNLYFLERLQKEFVDELSLIGEIDGIQVKTFIKPIDEIKVKYNRLDGNYSIYNNNGILYGDGNNASLELSGSSKFFNTISFYYQPIFEFNENLGGGENTDFHLLKGYAKLNLGNIEFEVGRDSLWWGPGYHGSLLMTNNAKPFDMVKISNPRPILIPWIFKYLGPFRATWFITRLEKDRVVPEPYLTGLRLDFKPIPVLEFGASRVIMMGGEGSPDTNCDDILQIITGKNISGADEDTSNQIASLDFSLILPFLRNVRIYGEWGGEDEANGFPSKEAYLAGIYIPRILNSGNIDLRVEYANNHTTNVWYEHGTYGSGYTYEGLIIGHHMGSDSEDIFLRTSAWLNDKISVGIDFDIEKRGKSDHYPEEHYQLGVDFSYYISETIEIRGRYGFEKVRNYDFIEGVNKDYHFLGCELTMQF